MRIALFTETFLPRVDGVTNTLCRLLDHLAACGHDSLLFAPAGAPSTYARTRIIGLNGWPLPAYRDFKIISPFLHACVGDAVHDFQPDLVHTLNPITLGLAAIRHARQLGVPAVASYHTDVPGFMTRWGYRLPARVMAAWLRLVHNQADLNLCPSLVTLAHLKTQGYQRLGLWGRGVDTVLFHPNKRSAQWRARLSHDLPVHPGDLGDPGDRGKLLLLFVGRLSHEKRVHWLRPIFDTIPNVRLAIVGDGPARPALERLFADTPTTFMGVLRGEDLAHAYATVDAFVFPSPNETLGNVVLEAMASGLPVIAPRSGGLLDHAIDGETALLFSPEDQNDFKQAVRRLWAQPDLAERLGQTGRARVEHRSWAAVLDGLLNQYAALITMRRAHPFRIPAAQQAFLGY